MIGSSIAISVGITWALLGLHGSRPHSGAAAQEDLRALTGLSGQLGEVSKNTAVLSTEIEALRRDLDRIEKALERVEERLP